MSDINKIMNKYIEPVLTSKVGKAAGVPKDKTIGGRT